MSKSESRWITAGNALVFGLCVAAVAALAHLVLGWFDWDTIIPLVVAYGVAYYFGRRDGARRA